MLTGKAMERSSCTSGHPLATHSCLGVAIRDRYTPIFSLSSIQPNPSLMDVEIHSIIAHLIQIDDWKLESSIVDGQMCKAAFDSPIDRWFDNFSTQDGSLTRTPPGIGM